MGHQQVKGGPIGEPVNKRVGAALGRAPGMWLNAGAHEGLGGLHWVCFQGSKFVGACPTAPGTDTLPRGWYSGEHASCQFPGTTIVSDHGLGPGDHRNGAPSVLEAGV